MGHLILGIDLGTTHSAVGVVDSGFPILLANETGARIIPSAVWFGPRGETEVGAKALRRRGADSSRVVTSIKRLIGRDVKIHGHSPEQISALILAELKRIAEWRMETAIHRAVITVPAYFNDAQRTATKRAGELAGLEVVRIVNEPTAAALAYGLDKLGEKSRVAIYDLGGGTFDLSILEMQDGVFQVIATHGDTHLGGDDLDQLIVEHIIGKTALTGISPELHTRLNTEAERVKRVLSSAEETEFRIPFYDEHRSISEKLTRSTLEDIAAPWIARTIRHCRQALADAALDVAALDAVVLVGGSTRMPAVRQTVASFFGQEPDVSQHPDEAIALGATIHAGVLSGALREMVLLDVTPLSLGIETFGGLMNVLIPRNTSIPCKAGEMFTNAADGQTSMRIRVLQGEREMARDNWELGEVVVPFEPATKGNARIGVQFQINENGILEVLTRDTATSTDTMLTIGSAAVDVDDAAVETMVSESVEHAWEDMTERIFTEAKLKAEELLPAVDSVLAQNLVLPSERDEIEEATAAVRAALQKGAANPLKSAVQRLDKATEALAARLVEQAMEEALERKFGPN